MYDVRQMQTISQTEAYTKRLKEQKVHLGEAISQRKLMNQVIKDQIALQRAQAVSWRKDSQGRIQSDLIIPRDNVRGLEAQRMKLGAYNAMLRSVSDQTVKWGKNTQWAGRQLMVGFTIPMGIAAAAAGKLAYDVDKALTNITKVYGDATQEFQDTTEQIRASAMETSKNMAAMYGQSITDTLEIEAQLAAAGKTGAELQQATAAATKARMLNEIDLQTAISATISMQTVYGQSAEEVGQSWEYINAMANQTTLSAEDFAIAIPKVSGLLQELGADLKDVGLLMTAFSAGGIQAAEGANALKTIAFRAVAPYNRGMETFQKETGKNLQDLVKAANGELMPLLDLMIANMADLNAQAKTQVFKDVFGIHQGNKALVVLEQLASGTGQVANALAVNNNSVAENALIANQELARMNAQPYKKIQKAIEGIKIEMQELGQAVLPGVAWVLQMVQGFLQWANGLDHWKKVVFMVIGGLIALAGPITMIAGLMGNLVGNVGKLLTAFGALVTRFKFTDAAERAQILVGKQATSMWDQQTSAVARLTQELMLLNVQFQKTSALNAKAQGQRKHILDPAIGRVNRDDYYKTNTAGKPYDPKTGRIIGRERMAAIEREIMLQERSNRQAYIAEKKRAAYARDAHKKAEKAKVVAQEMAEADERAANATRNRAQGIAGGLAAAGMLSSMLSDNSVITSLGNTAFMIGSVGAMFPSLAEKGVGAFQRVGQSVQNVIGQMGTMSGTLKNGMSTMMSFAKSAAIPLTIVAAGIALFWQKAREDAEKAAEATKAMGKSAETWSKVLGYNHQTPGQLAKKSGAGATSETLIGALADETRKADPALAAALGQNSGKKAGEKWAIAAGEAIKVKLTGGTEEAAKQAALVAMRMMNEVVSESDLLVNIKLDWDNPDDVMKYTMENIQRSIQQGLEDKGSGWDKWARKLFTGNKDLTKDAAEMAKNSADSFWSAYRLADESGRRDAIRELALFLEGDLKAAWEKGNYAEKGLDFKRFVDLMDPDASPLKQMDRNLYGVSADMVDQLVPLRDTMDQYTKSILDNAGASDQWREGMTMHEVLAILEPSIGAASSELGKMTEEQKKAAESADTLAQTLERLGIQLEMDKVIDEYKGVITAVQDDMAAAALDSLDREQQHAMDHLDAEGDALMDSFESRADALSDKYDAKEDALEKKQDDRKKRIEDYYDSRIKKVEDSIKAEQDAEAERQRIFEKEKQRLQRMSELYNQNVDLNAAITGGNFDEAAKIANDMASKAQTWSAEDSSAASATASDKRIAALEGQKTTLELARDAKLDALKATEDAENKALEAAKERDEKRLESSKKANQKMLDNRKKNLQLEQEAVKRNFQQELDALNQFIPTTHAELVEHGQKVDALYRKYGVTLKAYGNSWGKYINDQWVVHQKASANRVKSEIAWQSIGATISQQLLKGGFGMTASQFSKWFNGGAAPVGTLLGAPKKAPRIAGETGVGGITRHKGGIIDGSKGSRAGHSGKTLNQSEVMVNALKGEAVLNRKATDFIGEENINAINKGKLPAGTGPWDMSTSGTTGLAAMLASATMKRVMQDSLRAAIFKKAGLMGGAGASAPGAYAGVKLSQEQINNAMTIMDVGRSMGASQRDLQIALMTAMQESTLRNLNYGDRDSVGLFQQRPSQGWGSVSEIMNPRYSAKKFYEGLFRVKDRNSMSMTMAAQAVQRSAYPNAYAKWQAMAAAVLAGGGGGYTGFGANVGVPGMLGGMSSLAPNGAGWLKPVTGYRVSSEYGMRRNPVTGAYRLHGGIDLAAGGGTPIYAAARGQVSRAGWENSRGNFTTINHGGGIQTGYAHQSQMLVKPGQMVQSGQMIGRVGTTGNSTGNHLHFEYYRNGERLNPRLIIPQFREGGYTLSDGLAMMHKKETILSEPLSNDLHTGLNKFAEGEGSGYNVTIDMRGSNFTSDIDVEKSIERALIKAERKRGVNRKIGDKR